MKKILFFLLCFLININIYAGIQPIEFQNSSQTDLYNKIINNIKCVVCKAQSIVDSDTDFSNSMQLLIADQIKHNKSEEFITSYITDRYGDKVLLNPPIDSNTYILWLMPVFILIAMLLFSYKNLKKLF